MVEALKPHPLEKQATKKVVAWILFLFIKCLKDPNSVNPHMCFWPNTTRLDQVHCFIADWNALHFFNRDEAVPDQGNEEELPCTPFLQQKTTHLLSSLQIAYRRFKQNKCYRNLLWQGRNEIHGKLPLRFTPRCLSKASSISLDPRNIQGVVPHTKRWYFPT